MKDMSELPDREQHSPVRFLVHVAEPIDEMRSV
jgi:hypothetical protein